MITMEPTGDNTLKLRVSGKLDEGDFQKIGAEVDQLIRMRGQVKLLIDATDFTGWASMHAASKHFAFVRDHHKKIEKIALIAGHEWQHWIAGMAGVFVHPELKVFDKDELAAAESWLGQKRAA